MVHDAYFLLCIATKSAHTLPFRTAGADRPFGLERRIQTLIELAAVRCHSIGTHALEEPPYRTTIDGREGHLAGSGVVVGTVYSRESKLSATNTLAAIGTHWSFDHSSQMHSPDRSRSS
jgi:hypothetical protein